MTFLVVVQGDAGGWHVDRVALTEAVRIRWPEVAVDTSGRSEVRAGVWEFDADNGPGEAYLHEDGTCLSVDGWEDDAIWLATAFRRLPPPPRRGAPRRRLHLRRASPSRYDGGRTDGAGTCCGLSPGR